jgi:hypothetical protein
MNKTNLQIPIPTDIKNSAEEAALEMGFSSLQESVRVFLKKMAERKFTVSFTEIEEELSPRAIQRYNKIAEEIHEGKGVHIVNDSKSLMDELEK